MCKMRRKPYHKSKLSGMSRSAAIRGIPTVSKPLLKLLITGTPDRMAINTAARLLERGFGMLSGWNWGLVRTSICSTREEADLIGSNWISEVIVWAISELMRDQVQNLLLITSFIVHSTYLK